MLHCAPGGDWSSRVCRKAPSCIHLIAAGEFQSRVIAPFSIRSHLVQQSRAPGNVHCCGIATSFNELARRLMRRGVVVGVFWGVHDLPICQVVVADWSTSPPVHAHHSDAGDDLVSRSVRSRSGAQRLADHHRLGPSEISFSSCRAEIAELRRLQAETLQLLGIELDPRDHRGSVVGRSVANVEKLPPAAGSRRGL